MMAEEFSILISGIFEENQLHCNLMEGKKIYSSQIQKKVEKYWLEKESSSLFNGTVYSLIKAERRENDIFYSLQQTEYKYFFGTNLIDKFLSERADILAVCSVIETSDGYSVLGLRANSLAEGKNLWHVIGGSIDSIFSFHETAFTSMKKELTEEIGIENDDIETMICLGLGKNRKINKPEFLFYTKLKLSKNELLPKMNTAPDKNEHSKLIFIPMAELADFVSQNAFAIIGKAAVSQYLHFRNKQ
jgi:8-oxo-dGTP pyrophosphatase MutT (NUDIX family)